MIVPNIEIIAISVILLLGLPILWSAYKNGLAKSFSFSKLVRTINKSLKIQGILGLVLIGVTWIWNLVDFKFDTLLAGTTYTFVVIGLFMYLPALVMLNFIKYLIKKKMDKPKIEE